MPLIKGYIQPFEVKNIDTKAGLFTQAYTRYNVLDSDKDRGRKGMFTKTWKENFSRIRHIVNHNKDWAVGEPVKFWDDEEYAYMQSKIGTHNEGQDFIKMVESNLIKEASYGYEVVKSNKLKDGSTELLEVKLWEVSSLTGWGANEYTPVISLQKGQEEKSVEEALDWYVSAKSFVRNSSATDTCIQTIESEIKAFEQRLVKLAKRTEAAEALQPQEDGIIGPNDIASLFGFIEKEKLLITA